MLRKFRYPQKAETFQEQCDYTYGSVELQVNDFTQEAKNDIINRFKCAKSKLKEN